MNLLGRAVRMHLLATALLVVLDAAGAAMLRQPPYAAALAVAACMASEAVAYRVAKGRARVTYSSVITGLIIGSVSPVAAPLLPIAIASVVAIASKFAISLKSRNVFNPAALGMLVGLGAFGVGDEWWAAGSLTLYGLAVPLSLILILAAYEARRLHAALSFCAVTIAATVLLGGYASAAGAAAAALGVNYFFAFIMLTEPKTSPSGGRAQAAYGSGVAALYVLLALSGVAYTYFMALLAGNGLYALYRRRGNRLL